MHSANISSVKKEEIFLFFNKEEIFSANFLLKVLGTFSRTL
jgi:hypothetical protein